MTRVALLCSGLGHVRRGHEAFAADLFSLLRNTIDITLFKGGGESNDREIVVDHVPRNSSSLDGISLPVSPRWRNAAIEVERMRVEGETFAFAALRHLLEGDFSIVHCLEREVCEILYANRHLFRRTPKILWSNGGAIPAADAPQCDFVQEHSQHNLARSIRSKAFCIPHGVDLSRFNARVRSTFRARHGIPADAFVVISVGTICYWHKRMDYLIREVAAVPDAWLVIVGQENADSPAIKLLGRQCMGDRIIFATLPHDELPDAYAAADVFVLASLFETFGIAYIEALAMGLPVVCTDHPNQREIVKHAIFVNMGRTGSVANALRAPPPGGWRAFGGKGCAVVERHYDLALLRQRYVDTYRSIAAATTILPQYSLARGLVSSAANLSRRLRRLGRS